MRRWTLRRCAPATEARLAAFICRYDVHAPRVLPVPIWQVALEDGWHVTYRDTFDTVHGVAILFGDAKLLCVNATIARPFQRQAIAHELGHVLAGHTSPLHLCTNTFVHHLAHRQEREADLVAARLLIPPWALDHYTTIAELAAACDIPYELAALAVVPRA